MSEQLPTPQKGDWVQVWGLVTAEDPHPDEYSVRFESHNEHFVALVRRDHTTFSGAIPGFVSECTAMKMVRLALENVSDRESMPLIRGGDEVYVRCTKPNEHGGKHKHRGVKWDIKDSDGYVEDA